MRGPGSPLAGAQVVEVADGVAGRYCGRLLTRLGADVAVLGGAEPAPSDPYGRWLDEGKRWVAEPLDEPVDLVVVGPEAPSWPGVDAATVLTITWFAPGGPYSSWRGSDPLVLALAGLAHAFGTAEGPPVLAQGHAPQVLAGVNAANLALAALLHDPAQRPARLDVDVLESTLCLSEVGAVGAIDDPRSVSSRLGVNRFSPTYPCSSYLASDGWIGVTALTPAQWQGLCAAAGLPELAADPQLRTAFRRLLRGDAVDAALAPAIARRTCDEWVELGLRHRIPITAMPRPSELPDVPHWSERGAFAPIGGDGPLAPTLPFRWTTGDDVATASRTAPPDRPLEGIRVVDFTMGWAGPQATRALADLGADVVKVESDDHPDWYRGWEADPGGDPPPRETRASFNTLNRNKRGVALDLTTADGLAVARRLVASADVVIENYAAGVLAKLGLGPAELRRLRPGLVAVSLPAFGNDGPLTAIRAYGSTVEQASGLPFVNGEEAWPPSLQHVAFGDAVAGLYAVTAVLAGLHLRARCGGVDVDLAQVACLFEVGADAIVAEQVAGAPSPRTGSRRASADPCVVVRSAGDDAWLAVVVDAGDVEGRRSLAEVVGSPRLVGAALEAALAEWAAGREPAEAAARLQAAGVPAAPVQPVHALGADPHLRATRFWEQLDRAHVGRHTLGAPAFRIDGRRPVAHRPAPTLGQHTDEVVAALG